MCVPARSRPAVSRRDALAVGCLAMLAAGSTRRRQPVARLPGPDDVEVTPGLVIRRRSAWGADLQPKPGLVPEDVRFLLVHHTAGSNDDTVDEVPATLRFVYDFHTGSAKGWPDVCYNFFVDPYGTVWEGRAGSLDGPVAADATGGNQGFAQLVCVLGDFTTVMPTDAALESLTRTLAWLADRFKIDVGADSTVEFVSRGSNKWPAGDVVVAKTISGHRDMSSTACPGDAFYPFVRDQLPNLVRDRLHSPSATTPTVTTAPTSPGAPIVTSVVPTLTDPATSARVTTVAPTPVMQTSSTTTTATTAVSSTAPSAIAATTPVTDAVRDGGSAGSDISKVAIGSCAAVITGVAATLVVRQRRRGEKRNVDPAALRASINPTEGECA